MPAPGDNPAYQLTRPDAERLFAGHMERYDRHQADCPVCVPLPPGSAVPVTSPGMADLGLCAAGEIALWPAVKIAAGLKAVTYPEGHVRGKDGRCSCRPRRRRTSAPVTSHDTHDAGRVGDTTTPREDVMPSHASKAADKADADRAKAKLTLVPPPGQDKPATAGDAARAAARDALPPHQQARYDELVAAGTRHVTALAQARKETEPAPAPDPDPAPAGGDFAAAAGDLFAAFAAMTGGADTPAASLTQTVPPKDGDDPAPAPPAPKPVPAPAQPKPAPPKPKPAPAKQSAPRPPRQAKPAVPGQSSLDATCTVAAVPFDRFYGILTAPDGRQAQCGHQPPGKNGHITEDAAEACARKIPGDGTVTVGTFDRFNGAYTPKTDGAAQVLCGCKFGHKTSDSAVACARTAAAAAGLIA